MKFPITPLCKLAVKYRTDKVPELGESYTPYYHQLFKDKIKNVKNILEIGIGYQGTMLHVPNYITGASLYMWEEYFPNANIYACDIKDDILINKGRIKSFICNQSKPQELLELMDKINNKLDIIIDDGSHKTEHQIISAKTLMPFLKEDGIYIIEDVREPQKVLEALKEYNCILEEFLVANDFDDRLIIITKK